MTKQELQWAQQSLHKGARLIAEAGMRLEGTRYEAAFRKIWEGISNLNSQLIKDIKAR